MVGRVWPRHGHRGRPLNSVVRHHLELSRFERRVIEKLITGDQEEQILLRQLENAQVTGRNYSGVGLFVDLRIAEGVPPIQIMPNREIQDAGNLGLRHPQLEHGGGMILFVRGGFMELFECYTNAEDWPEDEDLFEVVSVVVHDLRTRH
jgi:hypothetical protein